jgi:Fe2+ transport system protein FeoA
MNGFHAPEVRPDVIPLSELRAGQTGRVRGVVGDGEFLHRLREMGLCEGVEICMLRPGCPCIVRLGSQRLCFRSSELESVMVLQAS